MKGISKFESRTETSVVYYNFKLLLYVLTSFKQKALFVFPN